MGKMNRTIQDLLSGPKDGTVFREFPNRQDIPPGRTFIQRLSYRANQSPIFSQDFEFLTETVRKSSWPGTIFVLDTSMTSGPTIAPDFWDAILDHEVVITPGVWAEMSAWRESPFCNAYFRDIVIDACSPITFFDFRDLSAELHFTYSYYIHALALRKYSGRKIVDRLREQLGREPSRDEIVQKCQRSFGSRGSVLAAKGIEKDDYASTLADAEEEIVVTAAFLAILSGREVCILTRDNDAMEQFRKLTYLLDTIITAIL